MLHEHPGGLVLTKRVVSYCGFPAGAKIVDIGCGVGTTVEYLRDERGLKAVGLDSSFDRLEQGKARSPKLPLIHCNATKLPFESSTMDGAIAECSLSVMERPEQVISEVRRILVDGGKFAITDLYVKSRIESEDGTREAVCQTGTEALNSLISALKDNGFQVEIWEDQSCHLQEFVAKYIMEHGSLEELRRCIMYGSIQQDCIKTARKPEIGYCLLVAKKTDNGRMK